MNKVIIGNTIATPFAAVTRNTDKINSLYYYGDIDIVPSDEKLFSVHKSYTEQGEPVAGITSFNQKEFTGDVIIPYEFVIDGEKCRLDAIESHAFENCMLRSVRIPNCVARIGDCAFHGCERLGEIIIIPKGVISIGEEAFRECNNILTVILPASLTQIGNDAFSDCDNIDEVYYAGSREQWEEITQGDGYNLGEDIHYNADNMNGGIYPYIQQELQELEFSLWDDIDSTANRIYNSINDVYDYVNSKESVEEDYKATVINIELEDDKIICFNVVDSVIVNVTDECDTLGFSCALYFTTPDSISENYSQFPSEIYFKGDSTDEGFFVPEANMRYTIVFDCDGIRLNAYVSGVSTI